MTKLPLLLSLLISLGSMAATAAEPADELPPFDVVRFDPGASTLSEIEKRNLEAIVHNAKANGKTVTNANIYVWPDREIPTSATEGFSAADQKLAAARIATLDAYLKKNMKLKTTQTYDITSLSNGIVASLARPASEPPSKFASKAAPQAPLSQDARFILRINGHASRAIVIFEPARP
jgi:cytochrome c556